VADDPLGGLAGYYNLDPRRGWRITNKDEVQGGGEISSMSGSRVSIKFPKYLGKYPKSKIFVQPYEPNLFYGASTPKPKNLPGSGVWTRWPQRSGVHVFGYKCSGSKKGHYALLHEEMMKVLKKIGMAKGEKPDFPANYFKNSLAMVYDWYGGDENPDVIGCYEITAGDEDSITFNNRAHKEFGGSAAPAFNSKVNQDEYDLSITINAWGERSCFAMVPKANQTYIMRSRRPRAGQYFQIMIGRQPYGRYTFGYSGFLGVSGKVGGQFTEDKNYEKRHWLYKEGKPQRTKQGGWIDILMTSSPEVKRQGNQRQILSYFRMIAPEVTEMYNASATPVSLANWRVICNTGSLATEIGRIRSTACYDKKLRKSIIDNNPVVHPGDHFYLVNNVELFDYWYGSGNGIWGSSLKEEIPVFQMDEENWGVTYKIKGTERFTPEDFDRKRAGWAIYIDENNLETKEIFDLETVKFVDRKNKNKKESWNNIFAPVQYQKIYKKNEIFLDPIGNDQDIMSGVLRGKSIMVLGMPHAGGIVSLTLKNEYEQICARTVDYGKVEAEEIGKSCEKIDPTKNTWIKRRDDTIGGYNKLALNRAMKSRKESKFFIKNGPYCSIGEMMHVTTGGNFERLGGGGNLSKGAGSLAALADVMCSSHVRLESCAGNVSRAGWKQAEDEVENSTRSTVTCKSGGWQVDQWKGQTLRFLTGKLRGEKFPIINNSKNVIIIGDKNSPDVTYSSPNRISLNPAKGDKFSLGPGYASALCFTRTGGEEGEWTWKNAINIPGEYNLYIYGLNDAIDTTEFLEENNNASLNVEVWNYETKSFDKLKKRGRYGKQDSFNAGKIKPEHISDSGDFRIKLIAYDIAERNLEYKNKDGEPKLDSGGRQTGIAWFNYAVITPVPVPGRVNINTASARMLASLPGITGKLAKNIEAGVNSEGKAKLKPYNSIGDIFKVRGMTPEVFERCANLLAIESSTFTVDVEAEVLKVSHPLKGGAGDVSSRKKITPDEIAAIRRKRFVVELDKAADGYASVSELEQYSP